MKTTEVVRTDRAMPRGASVILDEGDYILQLQNSFKGQSGTGNDKLTFVFESKFKVSNGELEECANSVLYENLTPFKSDGEPNNIGFEIFYNMICALSDLKSWEEVSEKFSWDLEPGVLDKIQEDLSIYTENPAFEQRGAYLKAYVKKEVFNEKERNKISRYKYISDNEREQLKSKEVPF